MERVWRASVVGALLAALVLVGVGCGEEGGVADGATVSVYVAAGACEQGQRVLAEAGGEAGSLAIRARCLPEVERDGRLDLARIGANARTATEDSTTIAYIGELTPAASRFSETILEEADIAQLSEMPGSVAMKQVLKAVRDAEGAEDLRRALYEELPLET